MPSINLTNKSDYISLHQHSELSTLDGLPKIEDYIIKAAKLKMPAMAITDHGALRGYITQYIKCQSNFLYGGVKYDFEPLKPVIGVEFYMSSNDYRQKGLSDDIKEKVRSQATDNKNYKELIALKEEKYGIRKRFHMLVFAKDNKGMENLNILNYLSWKNGFYYRPRIDMRLISKYHEGLMVTTSCIGGVAPNLLINKQDDEAIKWLKYMKNIFRDDFYIEIQPHDIDDQRTANKALLLLSDELKIKVIATNDCHYLNKEDVAAHNMLLDINSHADAQSGDRWRFGDTGFYMRSKSEMMEAFLVNHKYMSKHDIKNALENTIEIAEKSNVKLNIGKKQNILPKIIIPKEFSNEDKYLIDLCKNGWKWRDIHTRAKDYAKFKGITYIEAKQEYKDRLKLELKRIFKMKFTGYFLIIYDLIAHARSTGIIVGPGRGSSASSLVCYLTGITSVDPIRYDLMFDRFLSEYRVDLPDIDMDFEDKRRKELFKYIFDKYGWDKVCMVGTMMRMKGKAALHDVSRVEGVPVWEVNEVTRHIVTRPEGDARVSQTVEDSFKEFEVSKRFNERYPQILPLAKKLESKCRGTGVHACAIQIAPFKMYKYIPVEFRKDIALGLVPVSAPDWRDCQDMGLLKIDILGLGTLTGLQYAIDAIRKNCKVEIDIEKINLEDQKVLDNFSKGLFSGIFQFDSIGMRATCKKMKFTEFNDIIATNSLYRPGCISGDTIIIKSFYEEYSDDIKKIVKRFEYISVEELYKYFHNEYNNSTYKPDSKVIVSVDLKSKKFIKNKMLGIWKTGKKRVYSISVKGGTYNYTRLNKIESSIGHRFYTADGWKKLKDIKTGDYILVRYYNNMANSKRIINPEKWLKINKDKNENKRSSNLQGKARFFYKDECFICGYNIFTDVCHLDGVRSNYDIDNLIILCPNHHREFDRGIIKLSDDEIFDMQMKFRLKNSYDNEFNFMKVTNIEYIGVKETYDIECDKSNNNFIAGNVVVHNSARSGMLKVYIDRKTGKEKIKSVHPIYDEITKNTYGVMVYQEQLMQVFMKVAGYQPSKADIVRKKVSKSSGTESIWREREDFMTGAKRNNVPKRIAKFLFKNMSFFGSYAFNKAHSAAYSVISYAGMYLKTYYPAEFYYGLLKQESDYDRILEFIKEVKQSDIKVRVADINYSETEFALHNNVLYFGLKDIKGCGGKASDEISKNTPYRSLYEFCSKVNRRQVHKGVITALIKAGAFKSLYKNTGTLLKQFKIKDKSKYVFELMVEAKNEDISERIYKKFNKKKYKLLSEQEQRLIASVSPMPPDKHEIEYYSHVDKYLDKNYDLLNVKDALSKKNKLNKFLLKGIIVDIKYNQIGDFHKELPDDKTKERIGWGRRYASINIDDGTGIVRMKISEDVFSTFRYIIDKGVNTAVMVVCRRFREFNTLFCDLMVSLDEIRNVLDKEGLSLKEKYKELNTIQRYFLKHPVTFIRDRRFKAKTINVRDGIYKCTLLITKIKYHWTKKDDRMAFIELEDETDSVSVIVWPDILEKYNKIIKLGSIIEGKIKKDRNGCYMENDKILLKKIGYKIIEN